MTAHAGHYRNSWGLGVLLAIVAFVLGLAPLAASAAMPTIKVIGVAADGKETAVTDYRWLVEQDKTYHVQTKGAGAADPTKFDPTWDQLNDGLDGGQTLSVGFHRSYMPVVAKGCVNMPTAAACKDLPFPADDPDPANINHYYLSVVPRSGYSIGGASFKDGDEEVTVYVHANPIPTAQITVLVFEDNNPINNAADLPAEDPANPGNTLMNGFQVLVEDAGGRYGASAGMQSADAFGNPLGTTYNPDGSVAGFQPLVTGPDGRLTIKNLAPGKYGIQVVPPAGQQWQQTSTIEGTKVIDAWVKANEPPYFAEFGPAGFHVEVGFVRPFTDTTVLKGGATISGTVVNQHLSRPPDYAFYDGVCFGHTRPWVGLNAGAAGIGPGVYAAQTDENCKFSIPNVPPGDYQLAIWDSALDLVFGFKGITVAANGTGTDYSCVTPNGQCELGNVPVFQWFHRQEHFVFNDVSGDGKWDIDEGPLPEVDVGLRWRDGTLYQGNVTDQEGAYAFDQVFPFFSWLVAETGFVRMQATGVEAIVDNGGSIDLSNEYTFGGVTNPQDQTNPRDSECIATGVCVETTNSRIDLGPVLTAGFQGFLGQTNVFLWGKRHYPDGQNGGISGIVYYAVTRAENNPEYAAAEPWEPGIPGVTVNLSDASGNVLATTTTDSWDDSIPTGCKWGNGATGPFKWSPDGTTELTTDCYDGLRVFNQVRPAVFDGGYAFGPEIDCTKNDDDGSYTCPSWVTPSIDNPAVGYMKPGDYIVEVVPPPGYEIVKPEDKNVDFGDEYTPSPLLLPPACVGVPTVVPPVLTLFPDQNIAAPFAGSSLPLCDRKQVTLSGGANAAADFFLFTEVPIAAHAVGFILDDTQNEFDPNSPNFGEKYAPPFVPITIRDWTGRMIGKTLSDQYGRYNFLAPSTITANLPQPSGMSPNMLTTCMNDPGDNPNTPDPNWNQQYSTFCYTFQYMPGTTTYLDTPVVPVAAFAGPDQFPLDCEYPDGTPRIHSVSVATNGVGGGPYIPTRLQTSGPTAQRGLYTSGAQTVTISSPGMVSVQNPQYCNPAAGTCPDGADLFNKFVTRDYGFGDAAGIVTMGTLTLTVTAWSNTAITLTVPDQRLGPLAQAAQLVGGRQLTVTRANNGGSTKAGVTVQVGLRNGANVVQVSPSADLRATPITDAILANSTKSNDLILVQPGVYNEMVIMNKPVQLQGWGEGSTIINAMKAPPEKLQTWRNRVDALVALNVGYLVPGQEAGPGTPEPVTLWTEEGAGVLVLAPESGTDVFDGTNSQNARIDGFTIKGADTGGGVIVNGHAHYLSISNNRIANNNGDFGGGIRVGHPQLTTETADGVVYSDSDNDFVSIHHNQVVFNGGLGGAGGGISMCTGADAYQITQNWVCGNFSGGNGGGIAHYGRSDGEWYRPSGNTGPWALRNVPRIADNTVVFNESFFQGQTVSGGGILVAGAQPLAVGALSPGSGNVQVIGNLIQGNAAGAGDGGGIRLAFVNGQDVVANPTNQAKRNGNAGRNDPAPWNTVDVFNNMIANNVAALAGGGLSLQDAVAVRLVHNTIANNDSLATAGEAFPPNSPNESTPQPGAGIAARAHSAALAVVIPQNPTPNTYSNPTPFADNIVWHNRQFYFWVDTGSGCLPGDVTCPSTFGLCPDPSLSLACPNGNSVVYDDFAVLGTTGTLLCTTCLTTETTAEPPGPGFVAEYANGRRSSVVTQNEMTIETPAAFDEGGNFIRPRFGPLSLYDGTGELFGDYHVQSTSDAVDGGTDYTVTYPSLTLDFDREPRPAGTAVDIGADEVQP